MIKERGQVVIILLLIIVLALAIALSMAGRSINEISSATKIENSSRAFTAAEAGIERALRANQIIQSSPVLITPFPLSNEAQASVIVSSLPQPKQAIAYPPFGKESFAQFWLTEPSGITPTSITVYYNKESFDIYFGDSGQSYSGENEANSPAIQVNLILWDDTVGVKKYFIKKYRYDTSGVRRAGNGFEQCGVSPGGIPPGVSTSFYCKVTISGYKTSDNIIPVLARVRILYTSTSHPVAISPNTSSCANDTECSFPAQANVFKATGISSDSKRSVEVFRQKNVMPQFFDYAIFAAGELDK